MQNNLNNLTGSLGGWRRCSLVTDPGYAPRARLASRQNPGVILSKLFWIGSFMLDAAGGCVRMRPIC
jgi:hypothetical protein